MVVVNCSLFVASCLLLRFVLRGVCQILIALRCALFVVFVACCLVCADCCLVCDLCCVMCVVCWLMCVVCCVLRVVYYVLCDV